VKKKTKILETGLRIKTNLAGFSLIEVLTVLVILSILLTGTYFYTQTNKQSSQTIINPTEALQNLIYQEVRSLQLTNKLQQKILKKNLLKKLNLTSSQFSLCDTDLTEIIINRYGQWSPFQLRCNGVNYFVSNDGRVSILRDGQER